VSDCTINFLTSNGEMMSQVHKYLSFRHTGCVPPKFIKSSHNISVLTKTLSSGTHGVSALSAFYFVALSVVFS
jgi:hypothetical protein